MRIKGDKEVRTLASFEVCAVTAVKGVCSGSGTSMVKADCYLLPSRQRRRGEEIGGGKGVNATKRTRRPQQAQRIGQRLETAASTDRGKTECDEARLQLSGDGEDASCSRENWPLPSKHPLGPFGLSSHCHGDCASGAACPLTQLSRAGTAGYRRAFLGTFAGSFLSSASSRSNYPRPFLTSSSPPQLTVHTPNTPSIIIK